MAASRSRRSVAQLLFGVDEASTWSTRLDSGSEPLPKYTLAGVSEPRFGPAAVAAPELAGAGVCYATDEGLAIAVVAADGVPFAGQTTIPVQDTVLRCDIAWSGTAFLVVYTSRSTGSGTVHGQLLAPPL